MSLIVAFVVLFGTFIFSTSVYSKLQVSNNTELLSNTSSLEEIMIQLW